MTDERKDRPAPKPGATVLRSPGSGPDQVTDERTTIGTTQTAGGLAAGKPEGGPQRTPERRAIDKVRGNEPTRSGGRDPDLLPDDQAPVETPEDVNATPPHGDKTRPPR